MATRDDVRIPAQGDEIAAYVYRPQVSDGNTACVVMAHGFTGTRDDGLPGELRHYPYGHVDIYHDPNAKADQLEFPRRVMARS